MTGKIKSYNTGILFIIIFSLPLIMFAFQFGSAQSSEQVKILVLGDSLTAGYGLKKTNTFTAKLQNALDAGGWNTLVVNSGVSGDTTAGGLSRLSWALAENPHIVIVELGANDGLRGIKPSSTKANLDSILKRLTKKHIRVLLAGMLAPPNLGTKYGHEFNKIFPDLAKKHRIILYKFFLEGVANKPSLNQSDGIHPNYKGVSEIVRRILPFVITAINQLG